MLENIFLILGALFVVGIVVYSAIVASYRNLNSLEIVFLTVLGILVSALVSYIGGKKSLKEESRETLKGEAEKALRRITDISQLAGRISKNVQGKVDEFTSSSEQKKIKKSNELIREYFDGIGNQIEDLKVNIKASVEDWRDILPEDFKKKDDQNKKLAEAYEKAIQEKDAIERKYNAELKTYMEDGTKREALIKTLQGELDSTAEKYQAEIAKIKLEYGPRLSELLTLDEILGLEKHIPKFSQDFIKHLDNDTTDILQIVRKKAEEESEDDSTVAEIKDNNEEKEQGRKPDDGPSRIVLKDDSKKEGNKEKK